MASTRKKVLVRTRTQGLVRGYLDQEQLRSGKAVEVLSRDGQVMRLSEDEIQAVFFVADLEVSEDFARLASSGARPRLEGLWVRVRFRDNETLEGVLSNNLAELDGQGLQLVPTAAAGAAHFVYVPRAAIQQAIVLGVIGAAKRRKAAARDQGELFD